jgi:hypothetical protein
MWNMYGLQLAPRNASELQPVLMKTVFSRFATCPIASPDADEISPMIIATRSRSMSRSALADAVCGLTESSMTQLDLATHHPAGRVDLLRSELHAHDRVFAERTEEAGERRQVPDADGGGLRLHDRRHANEKRGAGRALDERTA